MQLTLTLRLTQLSMLCVMFSQVRLSVTYMQTEPVCFLLLYTCIFSEVCITLHTLTQELTFRTLVFWFFWLWWVLVFWVTFCLRVKCHFREQRLLQTLSQLYLWLVILLCIRFRVVLVLIILLWTVFLVFTILFHLFWLVLLVYILSCCTIRGVQIHWAVRVFLTSHFILTFR
jgi:hypothetical protein